jgi:hypothetical protein
MRQFFGISALVFSIVCAAWATRMIFGTPIRVNGFDIPVAYSIVPMLITGAMAVWAMRLFVRVNARERSS